MSDGGPYTDMELQQYRHMLEWMWTTELVRKKTLDSRWYRQIHSIKTDIACFFVTCEDRSQTPLKNHTILCVVELGEPLQTQENAVYDKFFITRAFLSIWQKLYIKFFLYLCYTHCVCPSDKLGAVHLWLDRSGRKWTPALKRLQ